MKRFSFFSWSLMLAMLVSGLIVTGCSEDEEISNPLKGTLWSVDDEVTVFEKHEFTRYIEFVDDKTVKVWTSGYSSIYTGTYSIRGEKVMFHELYDSYWGWYYINGTFSSKSLTIEFSYDEDHKTGPYRETYTKE